jgi:hypothetical protein
MLLERIHNESLDNFENIHDFYHSGLALGGFSSSRLLLVGTSFEQRPESVNTSDKAGAQISHLALGDDSSPWRR